jgi:serine/threonine protein kinase
MTGTDIAGYRILDKLGEGGMGVVYKAVDAALERTVAIKFLNPDLARNPELVARFRNEARAQANLNHTNLATLYAFMVQEGTAAMVMEFVDGETFEQMVMRRGPIPSLEVIPLFKQALLGIGYAHRAGIVHRDIKPSNLMVNHMGIVKVMDFGIAKVMGTRGMTRTGAPIGTGWYMSPEQVLNKSVDIRSDIYSLGITLYQMVSAHVPFEADSDFKIMLEHVNSLPPLPTKFYPYIPKGIENAILKALEKNPDDRFQTVEEFGSALERPEDFQAAAASMHGPPPIPFQDSRSMPTSMPTQTIPLSQNMPTQQMPLSQNMPTQHMPPPVPQRMPTQQPPPAMPTPQPSGTRVESASVVYSSNPAVSGLHTPPPTYPAVPQQSQPAFVPEATPVPQPQFATPTGIPAGKPFLLTPLGMAITGGGLLLLLLMGGWLALRPKAQTSSGSSTQSTLPPVRTPTPIEQQMNTPVAVTTLSSTPVSPPKVNAFGPTSSSVPAGQMAHLTWSVSGASEVTISPGIGVVKPEGSVDIPLRQTTQFTLVAKNEKGEAASSSTTVQVEAPSAKPNPTVAHTPSEAPSQSKEPPPPAPVPATPPPAPVSLPPARVAPEIAFTATPNSVQQGGSVILQWHLSNAASATITPAPGILRQVNGQYRVTPTQTTTFTLTATSKDGTPATATVLVQVVASVASAPPPAQVQRAGAVIAVYHDHGAAFTAQNRVPPACWGQLIINGNHLVYRVIGTNDGRRDDFDIALTQIQEAKPNRIPIRNQPAFHLTVGSQHLNFIPQGMSAVQAAGLIEGAAQGR